MKFLVEVIFQDSNVTFRFDWETSPTKGRSGLTCVVLTPKWGCKSKPSKQRVRFSEIRIFADLTCQPKDDTSRINVPISSILFLL